MSNIKIIKIVTIIIIRNTIIITYWQRNGRNGQRSATKYMLSNPPMLMFHCSYIAIKRFDKLVTVTIRCLEQPGISYHEYYYYCPKLLYRCNYRTLSATVPIQATVTHRMAPSRNSRRRTTQRCWCIAMHVKAMTELQWEQRLEIKDQSETCMIIANSRHRYL